MLTTSCVGIRTTMKQLFVLLAVICSAYGAWTGGLRVKFNVGLNIGSEFFFPIPWSLETVASEGWTEMERPSGLPLSSLIMYCPDDRVVCAMFDPEGNIAGMQIGIVKSQITGDILDWPTQGFTAWTATTASGESKEFWTTQIYFISEETLMLSREQRVRTFQRNGLMRESGIWVSSFYGELLKISNSTTDIADSIFTRQACIPWMGRHYYYNMTADALCTSDQLFPWFPLVHDGELVGTGLIMSGVHTTPSGERDWYEAPDETAVKLIVPDGSECLYNMASDPGITTMHVYFVEEPWWLTCIFN